MRPRGQGVCGREAEHGYSMVAAWLSKRPAAPVLIRQWWRALFRNWGRFVSNGHVELPWKVCGIFW